MGTDIYLSYDGQDMSDKYCQEGYIRASIGMINENYVLRQIFPPECWESEENNFKYTFDLVPKVMRVGEQYLDAVHEGYQLGNAGEAGVEHGNNIANLLKQILPEGTSMVMGGINDIFEAKRWLKTLSMHIAIGISKEQAGLNPKVVISW
jgi:hypothetical protein